MKCQYCNTSKRVSTWVPAGQICGECLKALKLIRLIKSGVPKPRITSELRKKLKEKYGKKIGVELLKLEANDPTQTKLKL